MANAKKVFKVGIPKAKDLKDYESIINFDVNSIDNFQRVLASAVPEIGRQMAKNNGWSPETHMKVLNIATSLSSALDEVGVNSYHKQAREFAEYNQYEGNSWNATDKCGNSSRNDFQDLYEQPEYEIIIRATAKLKDRNELAKRGVK